MTPEQWQRVRPILESALELDPAVRPAFLAGACTDSSLRREIESLILAHDQAGTGVLNADFPPSLKLGQIPNVEEPPTGAQLVTPGSTISPTALSPGTRFGPFEVQELLGAGGMGEVYRARDTRLNRTVAIKVLPPSLSSDPFCRKRFEREARAISALQHPNICTLFDVGQRDGTDYLVMEYLEGETLAARLRKGSLPVDLTLNYGIEISDALEAAHQRGVVHRDLKPGNIFLTAHGESKVLDFGLAKLEEAGSAPDGPTQTRSKALREAGSAPDGPTQTGSKALTEAGQAIGTVTYMSPEQARGETLDARTDIFSLGVVLYEMATGKLPFSGKTSALVFKAILDETPVAPTTLNDKLPDRLDEIIGKALEKDRELRYQSAGEVRTDLRREIPTAAPAERSRRRLPKWAIAAGVIVLAAGAFLAARVFRVRDRVRANSGPQIRSLAVLPFANLSADPAQEYFSDGMTDALITDLSQISSVKVISRTSTIRYKKTDKTLPDIARELNVDGIIEGTVQRSGDRVRITAQLIHGPADKHLWANSYEREVRNVFLLEKEVTEDIVNQVRVKIATPSQSPIQPRPLDQKVLDAYLQGNYHLLKADGAPRDDELRNAGQFFQKVIDAAPDFAPAYIGLAEAHDTLWWSSSEDFVIMQASAAKALELAPTSSEAHREMSEVKFADWDWAGAEEESRRAIEFNPNDAAAHSQLGSTLAVMGRMDGAWKEYEMAQSLDPNQDHLFLALYLRGQYDLSIELLQRVHPDDSVTHWNLFLAYAQQGKHADSVRELGKCMTLYGLPEIATRLNGAFATSGWTGALRQWAKELEHGMATKQAYMPGVLGQAYAQLGEKDKAFYWLEESCKHRHQAAADPVVQFVKVDPAFAPLRSDPRYYLLLQHMGLSE